VLEATLRLKRNLERFFVSVGSLIIIVAVNEVLLGIVSWDFYLRVQRVSLHPCQNAQSDSRKGLFEVRTEHTAAFHGQLGNSKKHAAFRWSSNEAKLEKRNTETWRRYSGRVVMILFD